MTPDVIHFDENIIYHWSVPDHPSNQIVSPTLWFIPRTDFDILTTRNNIGISHSKFGTSLNFKFPVFTAVFMTLSPIIIDIEGHFIADFLHLSQKSYKSKTTGLSDINGRSVATTDALDLSLRNGLSTILAPLNSQIPDNTG
jgi:hypothetical protein